MRDLNNLNREHNDKLKNKIRPIIKRESKGLKERVEGIIVSIPIWFEMTGNRRKKYQGDLATAILTLIEQEKVKAKLDRDFLALICYSVWQDGNIDGWEEHKKETKHFGDCTNEPNTCHVCFTANMYKLADKIQSQLKESERK